METNFNVLLQILLFNDKIFLHLCVHTRVFYGERKITEVIVLSCSVEFIYKIFICNIVGGNISIVPLYRGVGDNTLLIIKYMQIDTCPKLEWYIFIESQFLANFSTS